jgi:hypothetical protein
MTALIFIVCVVLVASKIVRALWEAKLLDQNPESWKKLKESQEKRKAKWRRGIGDAALTIARMLLDEK